MSDFKQSLEKKAKKLHRWATRRYIEEDGYHVEPWYEAEHQGRNDWSNKQVLTLDRYKKGDLTEGVDPNSNFYAPYKGEVWNQIYGWFDYIEDAVLKFGQSSPSALKDLLLDVKPIANYLMAKRAWKSDRDFSEKTFPFESDVSLDSGFGPGERRGEILLESAMQELDNFTGKTADGYVKAFGANGEWWEEVLENDYLLAEVLVRALEAQLAVNITQRESILNVCDATLEKLWGLGGADPSVKASTMLTVLGAVVGTTLTLATGGSALALVGAGFTITSAVVSHAEGNADKIKSGANKKEEINISGGDVIDILASFCEHVEKILSDAVKQENDIAEALRKTYDYVVENSKTMSKFEILVEKGTPKDDFGRRETSHNVDSLERAATQLFPGCADRILTVNGKLASSDGNIDGAFKDETTGGTAMISTSWLAIRDLLQDVTAANGAKIKRAGEHLLQYAIETGEVDADSAGEIGKVYDMDATGSGKDHEPFGY